MATVIDRDIAVSIAEDSFFYVINNAGTADFRATLVLLRTELLGTEAAATIKTRYEANADTNAFTDAEQSKLTAIEAGATADQSAAEILAALLTVDGTGTLLDADKLDGNEATAFAVAAHTHEGTAVLSTGEVGGTKFLREDGDGTSSWQSVAVATVEGTAVLSTGEVGGTKFLREDGDGTSSWQTVPTGMGDLLADGTVPLTANWDVGAFKVTANQLESDVATGTAPLVVSSTTVVTNLNADLLDGNEATALLARANHSGTQTASTISDFDTEVSNNADVTANTAKVTNATHTGEVTGATALTVQAAAIASRSSVTVAAGDQLLILDVSDSPNALKRISASDFATSGQANATHSGDATGATALTLQPAAITGKGAVTVAGADHVLVVDDSASPQVLGKVTAQALADLAKPTESIIVSLSDETTALTTGTAKVTFRMPYAFTLTAVRASVTTAPTGSTIIVDINEDGSTIMTTNKLSIDISEKTSTTAAVAAGLTDTALADDAEMTFDIDQIGSTIAGAGLKVELIGKRT